MPPLRIVAALLSASLLVPQIVSAAQPTNLLADIPPSGWKKSSPSSWRRSR